MEPTPQALRSLAHDLRNLLTAVRGHADLALRGLSAEDPAREDVAHVVVVTAKVFELVDQLDGLDASGTHIAVNLDGSVASLRRLLDALLPANIELLMAPDSGQAHVSISKLRIERIVLNLAMNARDAMAAGGTLSISTAADGQTAQIIVSDTGTGFSEEALEHLFEAGFTTRGDLGGSGNGLSAVAQFVDGAGGSIDVRSKAGEGATVVVTLPRAEVEDFSRIFEDRVAPGGEPGADPAAPDPAAPEAVAPDPASEPARRRRRQRR